MGVEHGAYCVGCCGGLMLALFALGGLFASAPVFAYFAAHGAVAEFMDAVWFHNLAYAQTRTAAEGFENLRFTLAQQLPSLGLLWAFALVGWWLPGGAPARVRQALAAWWMAALAGAAIGLNFRSHYFIQTLPALAALAGVGAAAISVRGSQRWPAARSLLPAALAALFVAVPIVAHRNLLFAGSPVAISRQIYGMNPFPEAAAIASHIRRSSLADERVLIVGSEPQILFLAQRRSATRYIFFYPLTGDYPDARERQQQVVDEVRAAPPRYVVWVDVVTSLLRTPESESLVFDATEALLANDYELELLAHLDASHTSYAIDRGDAARRWILAASTTGELALPTIAVYRRVR